MLDKRRGKDEFGAAMKRAETLIAEADIEESDREKLERLLKGVEVASLKYLDAVIDHCAALDAREAMPGDAAGWRALLTEKDRGRRFAHNALLDAVRILVRNGIERGVESMESYRHYMVDQENDAKRRWLGGLALTHAFERMLEVHLEDEE